MRILIVGAGAVGGYFGGLLIQAKRDVTFLVRAKRAAEIKARGLQIVRTNENLTLHPKTTTAEQITEPYDVILLGVKSYALSGAMEDMTPAVGPSTMILPALNGMRHIDLLGSYFGQPAVLGGVCMVATELDQEGRIRQLADIQKLVYGETDGKITERIQRLDAALRGAGFDTALSTHIVDDMWQKWVQLAALGTITCLLRGNIGEIACFPAGAELSLSALRECSAIASACGHPPSEVLLKQLTAQLTAQGSQLTSSMYRDLKKGAPVEMETILGDLLEHGRKHSLTTPIMQAAYVSLAIYQRGRDRAQIISN